MESTEKKVWDILETVVDPEVPVLSILDLGIVRGVTINNNEIEIIITPTYTGCPAMDMIAINIRLALAEKHIAPIKITTILAPAWTTDWITDEGKQKLQEYGIAPPSRNNSIVCPQCKSDDVHLLSEFGSTACKSLYQCQSCLEPFDYFKCH